MATHRLAHALGPQSAAPQRDHRPGRGLVERVGDGDLLAQPERLLALLGEEVGDAHAELALEHGVGVDGLDAPGLGHGAGGDGLARAHEAGEDERAVGQRRRHWMRSS